MKSNRQLVCIYISKVFSDIRVENPRDQTLKHYLIFIYLFTTNNEIFDLFNEFNDKRIHYLKNKLTFYHKFQTFINISYNE